VDDFARCAHSGSGVAFALFLLAMASLWLILSVRLWLRLSLIERNLEQLEHRATVRPQTDPARPDKQSH
jgi:hypothetical protein